MAGAQGEIEFVITVTDPVGTDKAVKKIVGSIEEIQTVVDSLNIDSFGKQLHLMPRDIKAIQQQFKTNKKVISESGGGFVSLTRKAKGFFKAIKNGIPQFRFISESGKEYDKAGSQAGAAAKHVVRFGRANKATDRTVGALSRKLRASFTKQQSTLVTQYTTKIQSLRTRMAMTGDASGTTAKRIEILSQSLRKLASLRVESVVGNLGPKTAAELKAAESALKSFFSNVKGKFQGQSGAPLGSTGGGIGGRIKEDLKKTGSQLSGALGFGMVTAGIEIQQLFRDRRLKNQLATGSKTIAQTIGGFFGSAIGSIAGDIGSAVGSIGELIINAFTLQMRLLGSAFGATMRGLGLLVISGFFAGIAGAAASIGLVPVLTAILIPAAFAVITFINDLVNELFDVVEKLFKITVSLISAGLKTIGLVITAGLKVIFKLWVSIWDGMRAIVKATFEGITTLVSQGMKLVTALVQQGSKEFVALQQGATRAAKELANQGNRIKQITAEISRTQIRFGFDQADTSQAFFNTISAGFRTTAERIRIISSASNLAVADQSTLANSTNALITVYANYGEKLSDIKKISELLSVATTIGVTSVEELGPALKSVVGIARFAGVGLKDLLGSIAALTQVFGKGSTKSSTKFFSRFIEAIAIPTSRARKEFEKLNISLADLQGGDFSTKFVDLLRKLQNVEIGDLREILPTVQSRRAFAGLAKDPERFAKILRQINENAKIQGQQTNLIFKQTFQRIKQVSNVVKEAKRRFGQLLVTILGTTVLSDRFFNLFLKIGLLMASDKFTRALDKMANFIKIIVKPLGAKLVPGFEFLATILKKIEGFNPFDNKSVIEFGRDLQQINTILAEYVSDILNAENATSAFEVAFRVIAEIVDQVAENLKRIDSGDLTFKNLADNIKQLALVGRDFAFSNIILGLSQLTKGINLATGAMNNADFDELLKGGKLSGRTKVIFETFRTLFRAIATFGKTTLNKFIDEAAERFRSAFVGATNTVVAKIQDLIRLLLVAVGTMERVLEVAFGDVAFIPHDHKKAGLFLTPKAPDRQAFAKEFPDISKDLIDPLAIKSKLASLGIQRDITQIVSSVTDATQRDLLRKPLITRVGLEIEGAAQAQAEIEKVFKAYDKFIRFVIARNKTSKAGQDIEAVPGLKQLMNDARLWKDPDILKRMGKVSIADSIRRQLLPDDTGKDQGGIGRDADEKLADIVTTNAQLIKENIKIDQTIKKAEAGIVKSILDAKQTNIGQEGTKILNDFGERGDDDAALKKKLAELEKKRNQIFREERAKGKTNLRSRLQKRQDQFEAAVRRTNRQGVKAPPVDVKVVEGAKGSKGAAGVVGLTGARSLIQRSRDTREIQGIDKRHFRKSNFGRQLGQQTFSGSSSSRTSDFMVTMDQAVKAGVFLPRGKGPNNPGFNPIPDGADRTDRTRFTRSGRPKGNRRDITRSLASALSGPISLPRGVIRHRRGQSLFDNGSGMGGRFSGQTALGIARAGRSGVTSPLEGRIAPVSKEEARMATVAVRDNTEAIVNNSSKQEATTRKIEANTRSMDTLNRTMQEEQLRRQTTPGRGIGAPSLSGGNVVKQD